MSALTQAVPHAPEDVGSPAPPALPPGSLDFDDGTGKVSQHAPSDAGAEARALHDAGIAHFKRGSYDEALESYEKALEIKEAAPGDNIASIAYTLGNIAAVYEKRRKYDLALNSLEKALNLQKSDTSGVYDSSVAVTLSNLGDVHRKIATDVRDEKKKQEHYNKAMTYYEEVLKKKQATHGDNDLSCAATLDSLGVLHLYQKEYTKALSCFEKAVNIKDGTPQTDDPSAKLAVATTLTNMGVAHDKQRTYTKALDCHEKALEIKKDALKIKEMVPGPSCEQDYSSIALTLGNLGTLRCNMKEYDKALEHHEEALQYLRRAPSVDPSRVAHTLFSLGSLHERNGEPTYFTALDCYKEALKIRQDIKDDASVARTKEAVDRVLAVIAASDAAQDPSAPWKDQCQRWVCLSKGLPEDPQTPLEHARVLKSHVSDVESHLEELQDELLVCRVMQTHQDSQPFCVHLKFSHELRPVAQAVIKALVSAGGTVSFLPASNST